MKLFKASLFYEENNGLKVTEFSSFDMGGYFPMRLVNMVMASGVKKSLPRV